MNSAVQCSDHAMGPWYGRNNLYALLVLDPGMYTSTRLKVSWPCMMIMLTLLSFLSLGNLLVG